LPFSPRFHALQRCPGAPRRARAPKLPGGAHRGWAGPPAREAPSYSFRTPTALQAGLACGSLRQRHAALREAPTSARTALRAP
jgi:hypothetical protein